MRSKGFGKVLCSVLVVLVVCALHAASASAAARTDPPDIQIGGSVYEQGAFFASSGVMETPEVVWLRFSWCTAAPVGDEQVCTPAEWSEPVAATYVLLNEETKMYELYARFAPGSPGADASAYFVYDRSTDGVTWGLDVDGEVYGMSSGDGSGEGPGPTWTYSTWSSGGSGSGVDLGSLPESLVAKFETAVTKGLPVLVVIIAGLLTIRAIRAAIQG